MTEYQYKRNYELTIQNRVTGKILLIKELTLSFDIKRTVDNKKESNTAEIHIFNLGDELLKLIDAQPRFCSISLDIGYGNKLTNLVVGDIVNVSTKKTGADRDTTFTVGEGFKSLNTTKISESHPEGVTIKTVIQKTLSQSDIAEGILTGDNLLTKLTYGYPAHGTLRQVLDELCHANDLEWMIVSDKLYVKDKNGFLDKTPKLETAYVLSSESGMIEIPFRHDVEGSRDIGQADIGDVEVIPHNQTLTKTGKVRKFTKEKYKRRGVKVSALINPSVIPNSLIKIETQTTLLDGFYRVRTIQYKGDTRGNDWIMEIFGDHVEATQ